MATAYSIVPLDSFLSGQRVGLLERSVSQTRTIASCAISRAIHHSCQPGTATAWVYFLYLSVLYDLNLSVLKLLQRKPNEQKN